MSGVLSAAVAPPGPAGGGQARVLDHPRTSSPSSPGSRLPSIATLTQEYGIARTTAGKALRLLVDEGLAEMSTGMGTFVKGK